MAKKVEFSTKYDYYTKNFESKLKKYNVGERESLREDRYISSRWFEINYNAAKEYLIEKHREREMAKPENERNLYNLRPSYKRIIETMVNKTLFAYEPATAKSIARFYNQQLEEGDKKISYIDLLTGKVDKSELDLNTIYREKQKEYFELFPEMSSSDRKGVSNARKYAKEWISKNIFGSP